MLLHPYTVLRPPSTAGSGPPACPATPSITCSNVPVCGAAGDTVQLAGSCNSSDPAAVVVYEVNGVAAANLTCPLPGAVVAVGVKPAYPASPSCPYNVTTGFNVSSEWRGACTARFVCLGASLASACCCASFATVQRRLSLPLPSSLFHR